MPIRRESGLTDWTQDAPDPLYETILRRLREKNYNAALASPLDRIPRVQDFGAEPGGMHGWIEEPEEEIMRRMALGERYHSRIGKGGVLEGNYPEAITPGESRRGGFEYETARLPDFREELPAYLQDATDAQARIDAASVVPPLYSQYNPAGAYAEAGRTVPNYASDWARGMNQVAQPFGGMGAGDRLSGPSVVAPPRMPTEKEILDRGVMGPVNERDAAFSKIHGAYYTGADFGYEQGWPERLGVPQEYIDVYMAVPDEAKQYAHDNPTDAILQQFEEKYGFPLDVSVEISM